MRRVFLLGREAADALEDEGCEVVTRSASADSDVAAVLSADEVLVEDGFEDAPELQLARAAGIPVHRVRLRAAATAAWNIAVAAAALLGGGFVAHDVAHFLELAAGATT